MTEPYVGRESGQVRTDLYCHACDRNFTADLDYDCNGNHVIFCPHCRHEHCRVIQDGVVTGDRWDSRNGASGAVWYPTTSATTTGSMFVNTLTTYASGTNTLNRQFLRQSWNATGGF